MVVRDVESRFPTDLTPADLGQATAETLGRGGERFILISYLTSPVPVRTGLTFVLFGLPPAGSNEDLWLDYVVVDRYDWTVTSSTDPSFLELVTTEFGSFTWTAQQPGQYTTRVEAKLEDGTLLATLSLTQTVQARNAQLETFLARESSRSKSDALRELINDLRNYIITAATATGPPAYHRGCSPRWCLWRHGAGRRRARPTPR